MREWTAAFAPESFFDLYAGAGTFGVLAAPRSSKIYCIEENPSNVQALLMNKKEKGLDTLEVIQGRVEKVFPELFGRLKPPRPLVFLDPPRQGLSPALVKYLTQEKGGGALIYVSCDPSTLARDLRPLTASGHWTVESVVPFDMFPRTKHIEVAVFMKAV